jgi:hypothetical protein
VDRRAFVRIEAPRFRRRATNLHEKKGREQVSNQNVADVISRMPKELAEGLLAKVDFAADFARAASCGCGCGCQGTGGGGGGGGKGNLLAAETLAARP